AVQDEVHSPSPKRSAISRVSAASAASASAPLASMVTFEPLPAASIITPMMLFAFTRRPLRESQISLWKPLARCVNLAAARACSPSLLMISASMLAIQAPVGIHVHDALGSARQRALHRCPERAVAARQHAQQHRQRHAGHAFDLAIAQQPRHHVARGGAEDVGEHEHAVAGVDSLAQHQVVGVVMAPDAQRGHLLGRAAQDLARAREQRGADLAVRDQQHADHWSFFSSAATNMPATSKPVWSWISRKQVGLVTFTSVSQSPMMSRPTTSRPRLASVGPRAWAISLWRALRGLATPRAPAARLPRDSPAFGMRARQCGTTSPSMSSTRWSPAEISGM